MLKKLQNIAVITLLCVLIVCGNLHAQKRNIKDSLQSTGFVAASYGYFTPGGDMADRFGDNSTIGAYAGYKSSGNHFFALEWNYIFGEKVKEIGILDSISTTEGYVIDVEGKLADIRIFQRGFTLHAQYGRVFPIDAISPNPNSGLFVTVGVGMMQHKIRILDNGARSPQLTGDYLKGYDRLTSGVSFSQFVGYWYMSNSRYVNFYCGIEAYQGITKSRRSWDYDLMKADTRQRTDLLWGLRAGWVIPLYRRSKGDYF